MVSIKFMGQIPSVGPGIGVLGHELIEHPQYMIKKCNNRAYMLRCFIRLVWVYIFSFKWYVTNLSELASEIATLSLEMLFSICF